MPSDPTTTEAEMREATEWYKREWPRRNKDADNWRTVDVIISAEEHRDDCCAAYAAALAKCRNDVDKIRADERERCAKMVIKILSDDKSLDGLAQNLAAAIRGGAE